jgi:hypothetical protein
MKKIFFIAVTLTLATLQTVRAHGGAVHEVGVSAYTGLSTLLYKSTGVDGAVKAGAGGGFSLDYGYNFNPNWAVVTGVSLLHTQQRAESKSISQSVEQTYIFDEPVTLYLSSTLENWTEKQRLFFLQIPIMARYQSALNGETQYHIAFGGKISFNIWNSYDSYADRLVTEGNFDEFKQVFSNVPSHNWLTTNNVEYNGNNDFLTPEFSLAFEIGVKQIVTGRTWLYAGLFCEYGLSNLNSKMKHKTPVADNELISYDPDDSRMFKYTGLLQSNTMRENRVNLFSAGLKLRFTFCLGEKK